MVKRRIQTFVDEEVIEKLDRLRGETSVYKLVETFVLEGVKRLESGTLEGSTGQSGNIVQPEVRPTGERDWGKAFDRKKR